MAKNQLNKHIEISSESSEVTLNMLRSIYEELERRYAPKGLTHATYSTPVNFKESLSVPIHRWYAYKEGFSPSFVRGFVEKYSTSSNSVVFDPFGGVGTTIVESSILGHNAYSLDVSPLGNFAAQVKTKRYSASDIGNITKTVCELKDLSDIEITVEIQNETVKKYFSTETFESLLKLKSFISTINDETTRNLFSLALLSIIEGLSTHRKNGNGVKRKIHAPNPVSFSESKLIFLEKVQQYLGDIETVNALGQATPIAHSCLEPYSLPEKADVVITSPPYANCFDYSKVYLTELWMGDFFRSKDDQNQFRNDSVTSHVHYRWETRNEDYCPDIVSKTIVPLLRTKDLWSNTIPAMIQGYFSDMGMCLKLISDNLNHGATVGFVVGNPTYSGIVVAADLIIANIAEQLGYDCIGIDIYRQVVPSSQQTKLIEEEDKKFVRESLVILKWE